MTEKTLNPEFEKHVAAALKEVSTKDLGPVTADRPLSELGLDSVSVAELMIVLEDKFDVSLEQGDLEQLKTFGDLQDLIERAKAG
ncbi:MAG: acyl carrier protein [Candidatus Eremiobacterota bacterium]